VSVVSLEISEIVEFSISLFFDLFTALCNCVFFDDAAAASENPLLRTLDCILASPTVLAVVYESALGDDIRAMKDGRELDADLRVLDFMVLDYLLEL